MHADDSAVPDKHLGDTLERLRRFNPKKELRSAVNAVRTTLRLRKLTAASVAAAAAVESKVQPPGLAPSKPPAALDILDALASGKIDQLDPSLQHVLASMASDPATMRRVQAIAAQKQAARNGSAASPRSPLAPASPAAASSPQKVAEDTAASAAAAEQRLVAIRVSYGGPFGMARWQMPQIV
jgi:hypothetical protein